MRSMPRRTSHMPETAHHNGKTTMHVESIAQKLMHAAIWLWSEYPNRGNRTDTGIDLVAEQYDGKLCAIQCKFYDSKKLTKPDIDSFLEAGSRSEFDHMILFYSAEGYGRNVEDALVGHRCQVLDFKSLSNSNMDWPDLAAGITSIRRRKPYDLYDHQQDALNDMESGLKQHDRGQMLMACGTGKTLTSLRMAERMAGRGGLVLYAVPSITLVRQSVRYWSKQQTIPHSYIGVCSDPSVSYGEKLSIPIIEMEVGVSTDGYTIAKAMKRDADRMVVVFTGAACRK